ncbi:MAG: FAD-dependent oxidoreductase [Candidatus Tumulicola sp.]
MSRPTYAIVGGGVAGASAAEALRGEGFDGRIELIGAERDLPYERPPLSKTLLRGETGRDSAALRAPEFYARNSIELRLGEAVSRLDIPNRRIELAGGGRIAYDKVLVATGTSPRRLGIPGGDLAGIHYLRTLDDAALLASELQRRPALLVIGSGFIGCEVAASARQVGCEVTVVGPTLPMERALGAEVGAIYAGYHRARGVTLKSGHTIDAFLGTNALEAARLSDGSTVACDAVVVGIGVTPSVSWLGDELGSSAGVETDEFCRTNVDGVFAAGDVAFSWRPRLGRRIRLEHFDNAESQGAAAGRAMHGTMRAYDPIPFFWSDQYDFSLQYYGHASKWDRVVLRGPAADGSFIAFYLEHDRIEAICAVNRSRESSAIKRLIGRSDLPPQELAIDGPIKNLAAFIGRTGEIHEDLRV